MQNQACTKDITFIADGFLFIVMNFLLKLAENESIVMNFLLKLAENESVVMELSVRDGRHFVIGHENQMNVDDFQLIVDDFGLIIDNNHSIVVDFIRCVPYRKQNVYLNKPNMDNNGAIARKAGFTFQNLFSIFILIKL